MLHWGPSVCPFAFVLTFLWASARKMSAGNLWDGLVQLLVIQERRTCLVWTLTGRFWGGWDKGLALQVPGLCHVHAWKGRGAQLRAVVAWASERCQTSSLSWDLAGGFREYVWNPCSFHLVPFAPLPVLRFHLCLRCVFACHIHWICSQEWGQLWVINLSSLPCTVPGTWRAPATRWEKKWIQSPWLRVQKCWVYKCWRKTANVWWNSFNLPMGLK